MTKRLLGKHFIKQWRLKRGYSLRKLASMMEAEPGVELVSHATLNRIENGLQPYSEEILNALAEALNVPVYMLLEHNPDNLGAMIDIFSRLSPENQELAIRLIEKLAGS